MAQADGVSDVLDGTQLLKLAGKDKAEAERRFAQLTRDDQLAVICNAEPARRVRLLELSPEPEALIPRIPEAELCFTVKAVGLDDAAWILEYARADQLVASIDLDGWDRLLPDMHATDQWLRVFAEAGEETLLRAGQAIDPELWVLILRERLIVELKPSDQEGEGWQPAEGAQTLDGQFYFTAKASDVDLTAIEQMLRILHQQDYWLYFRLLQGTIWEMESDLEEWALRWRNGRLQDLGFPSWDEAMQIYGFIRPEQRSELPPDTDALDVLEWHLPVWVPELPAVANPRHAVFRAAAELDDEGRRGFFYAFIGLANKVAVADHRPLGDSETLPETIEKAAALASAGLECIATEHGLAMPEVLRRVPLERLFRVGANLDPDGAAQGRALLADADSNDEENGENGENEVVG